MIQNTNCFKLREFPFTVVKKEVSRQISVPLGPELKSVESDFEAVCSRARVNTVKSHTLEDGSPPMKSVSNVLSETDLRFEVFLSYWIFTF